MQTITGLPTLSIEALRRHRNPLSLQGSRLTEALLQLIPSKASDGSANIQPIQNGI
jgi:hypothetical protein